jgi:site-specific recombinase XerD
MELMTPENAVQAYLDDRKHDLAESSHQNHKSRLQRFLEWCEENEVTDMNDVSGKDLHQFKQSRAEEVAPVTLNYHLGTLRQFLQFCERLEVAPRGIHERVSMPEISEEEYVSDQIILKEEAEAVLEYASKFDYASLRHVSFYLLWETGMRTGAARALDIEDFHPEEGYLNLVNRPTTKLKNRERGERQVNISDDLCTVIQDYIDTEHPKVPDDEGRMPLLGTGSGRPHYTTIQSQVYTLTRPCAIGKECPHDRAPDACEAATYHGASKCPDSVAPHAVRRGSITAHRMSDVPKDIASDRMDVSREVLEKHYDGRTKEERRRQRENYLNDI